MDKIFHTWRIKIKFLCILLFSFSFSNSFVIAQNIEAYFTKVLDENEKLPDYNKIEEYVKDSLRGTDNERIALKFLIENKYNLDPEKRYRVSNLFNELAISCADLEVRQEALFHFIDMHYIVNRENCCFSKEVFTKKVIARIIEVLEFGIKEEEIDLIQESTFYRIINSNSGKKSIEKTQKETGCTYEEALEQKKREFIKQLKPLPEPPQTHNIIKVLGMLKKIEYAPFLEKLLKKERFSDFNGSIHFALACMGYKNYGSTYIKKKFRLNSKFGDSRVLLSLGSKELCLDYVESNNSLDIVQLKLSSDEPKIYTTRLSIAIEEVKKVITNFPKEKYYFLFAENKNEIAQMIEKTRKAYNWLNENRENLQLARVTKYCL